MPTLADEPGSPFADLRARLVDLPATGDAGFEGLVATACAQVAGVPFRLVASGKQFGRDAEAVIDGNAILFEAKRYDSRLPFHALSMKLQEALDRSGRRVEVWGAAATVALEAHDAEDLRAMGEKQGVTVLLLDWAQPMPSLAVLLASAREATLGWFGRHAPSVGQGAIAAALDEVRDHPLHAAPAQALARELGGATLGLGLARRRNAEWMVIRFRDRMRAIREFGQPLAPLDGAIRPRPLPRESLEERIRTEVDRWSEDAPLVVLTGRDQAGSHLQGDEGVGKTWAMAMAWSSFRDEPDHPRPLLLVMPSHAWRDGDEQSPMRLLSRLLAIQTGASEGSDGQVDRWERRLELWLQRPLAGQGRPALIVVLDGVNERTGHPWAALISDLCDLARRRPIRVVVTTRRGHYDRELAPRLTHHAVVQVPVDPFSDEDLDAALAVAGRDPASVREPLRTFLRNPRILSVGLRLLDRLDTGEVGVERLLLEYLRTRQEERAPHASHTPEQFSQTLVRHARELLGCLSSRGDGSRSRQFDEATMTDRLGLPPILVPMAKDLQDVVDGRFLQVTDARRGRYSFTREALPLALGLLVVDELDQAAADGVRDLDAHLERIIDPIAAIDATSDILLAAFEVALADPRCADAVAEELLQGVLALQNVPEARRARVFAGLREKPNIYVTVTERLFGGPDGSGRRDWMMSALVEWRDHDGVASELSSAVGRWLRSWQPVPIRPDLAFHPDEQRENLRSQHAEAEREHLEALGALTPGEREFVERHLLPLPPGRHHGVDQVAVRILAGRRLEPFAEDLFAWCVASALGWRTGRAAAEMRWLRRLAPHDWEETTAAIGRAAAAFPVAEGSKGFHWAIQRALYDSGDPTQAVRADETWPLLHDGPRTEVIPFLRDYCDAEPLDPGSGPPRSDLARLVERYRAWSVPGQAGPPSILMRSGATVVTEARTILCRFAPAAAAEVHRSLARVAPSIAGTSPAFVAQGVVQDAAILGAPETDVLLRWVQALRDDPHLPRKESDVPAVLLTAILPHLSPELQFEAHQTQRRDASDAFWLGRMLTRLPDQDVGDRLERARTSGDAASLRLALLHAAETGAALDVVRPSITSALRSQDPRTRGAGLRSMLRLDDREGMEDLAASGWSWSRGMEEGRHLEDFCGSLVLLRTYEDADDPALLNRIHPALWSRAAEGGGPRLATRVADILATTIVEIPSEALCPEGMDVTVVRSDEASMAGDLGGVVHSVGFSFGDRVSSPGEPSPQRPSMSDYGDLAKRLTAVGRDLLLYPMTSAAIDRIAWQAPDAFASLLDRIEDAIGGDPDTPVARAAAVLAHDVARAISPVDPGRAAAMFEQAGRAEPLYPEVMSISHLPRTSLLLWRAADDAKVGAIRRHRLDAAADDEAIAFEVLAAETAGKHPEIVAYVHRGMTGRHPAHVARAVTIAGFSRTDPALDEVFEDDRLRHGFLSEVRDAAKRCYDEARWAEHWFRAAMDAGSHLDVWRFSELALAAADVRAVLWPESDRGGRMFEALRPLMRTTLGANAASKRRDRRKKLFGDDAPPDAYLPNHR